MQKNLFHLAFPVHDLAAAREFYGGILGCAEGRSSACWIDFDLYGHQIVTHLAPNSAGVQTSNSVDADDVPIPHFGIVLRMDEWKMLAERLRAKNVEFIIEPKIRFKGETGEQATMFFLDPSGNALEFKGFNDFSQVFAK
ncbi:MAG: VOC family protein [Acidobacteria bacterium]|nr:VOC family protein [Acidobacteriota bacterium]